MDALLPSEIARLVLGYLEEQKCTEAAKIFLEMSPNLQECRTVAACGRKFSTRVNGLTLSRILEKFCSANMLVQEKLSKLDDCEQLKNCGDLVEQLKFLVDESRGSRFVVNISVPTQNTSQSAGGSPIISSSMRKRRHSGPIDRDKNKRPNKSHSLSSSEKQPELVNNSWCDGVEATSLDQLPGHSNNPHEKNLKKASLSSVKDDRPISSTVNEPHISNEIVKGKHFEVDKNHTNTFPTEIPLTSSQCINPIERVQSSKCSTGTDTEELMRYTTSEVQTATYEIFDNESEMTDGPIENLSLLSKEILARTDLQEVIAENINKVADLSMRATNSSENPGDCNTSIATELDNVIKSAGTEIEADPIWERFLHEMIGPRGDVETSPDEDAQSTDISPNKSSEHSPAGTTDPSEKEIPKNINVLNNESTVPNNKNGQETTALDDVNAAAILSIIKFNTAQEKPEEQRTVEPEVVIIDSISPPEVTKFQEEEKKVINPVSQRPAKKSRKLRIPKQKRETQVTPDKPIPKMEIMEMPTLIVCSKEEINTIMSAQSVPIKQRPKSQFVPIAPKDPSLKPNDPVPQTLFLRTVNVPTPVPVIKKNETMRITPQVVIPKIPEIQSKKVEIVSTAERVTETITLYGDENEAAAIAQPEIAPEVHVEESISMTGTGLSPFLKLGAGHRQKFEESRAQREQEDQASTSIINQDLISKRTPKSILKSRSKNNRLSLSTPRRRSNHIRALDFNTPTKGLNSSRRNSDANNSHRFTPKSSGKAKSGFRTSLFKSPPFSSSMSGKKQKSPVKISQLSHKVPIATRGPTPKLSSGWDKYTGVGMIIDGISSQSNSCSSPPEKQINLIIEKPVVPVLKKSWDDDLRRILLTSETTEEISKKVTTKKNNIPGSIKKITPALKPVDTSIVESKKDTEKEIVKENKSIVEICDIEKKSEVEPTKSPSADIDDDKNKNVSLQKQIPAVKSTDEKGVTKKYATLKTLTTTVTRVENKKRVNVSVDSTDFQKVPSMIRPPIPINLATPRKVDDTFEVPPTPRVLSPSSNITTPFIQVNETSEKVQGFVSTPEFPPTPNIALTPKENSDNTIEGIKDGDFVGSSYYEPSSELQEKKIKKIVIDNAKLVENEVIIIPKTNTTTESIIKSVPTTTTGDFQSSSTVVATSNKLEITQFEVIKDNLSREDAFKELKISSSSKDLNLSEAPSEKNNTLNEGESLNSVNNDSKINIKSIESSRVTVDSSDSDSDSSSSGSSSSSSCCNSSCCMNDTNTSSRISIGHRSKKTPHKIDTSVTNKINDSQKQKHETSEIIKKAETQPVVSSTEPLKTEDNNTREKNEASPTKVFPIIKPQDLVDEDGLETPAKDDALLEEAGIGETPSSSKTGIDTLTNLSSKISAFAKDKTKTQQTSQESSKNITAEKSTKPTIRKIETVSINIKSTSVSEVLNAVPQRNTKSTLQSVPIMDAKLCLELEEKRLRVINKFKAKPIIAPRSNAKKITTQSKNVEEQSSEQSVTKSCTEKGKRLPDPFPTPKGVERKARVAKAAEKNIVEKEPEVLEIEPKKSVDNTPDVVKEDKKPVSAVRKSLRNVGKNGKRGISEPPERSEILKKIEPQRKAQSSREPSVNDDFHIENEILRKKQDIEKKDDLTLKEIVKQNKDLLQKENENKNNEHIKEHAKSKVDMVKRDLFSDDENNDQRTTRSRSRLISDAHKSDSAESHISLYPEKLDVLECLELVPSNKALEEQEMSFESTSYENIEICFVYDDSVQTKKRRRKYSNSELEFKIQVEGKEGEDVWKVMTATPIEEIFSMSPARRKRTIAPTKLKNIKGKDLPTVVSRRRAPVKLRDSKSIVSTFESLPLATSSPIQDNPTPKNIEKISKNVQAEPDKVGVKTRKRKNSESKDDGQAQKKSRVPDPKVLLNNVDLNRFLTTVHGPE